MRSRGSPPGFRPRVRPPARSRNLPDALPCPHSKTLSLASTSTDLSKKDPILQERLINWGYAVCDVAMRRYVDPSLKAPAAFPYPESAVG